MTSADGGRGAGTGPATPAVEPSSLVRVLDLTVRIVGMVVVVWGSVLAALLESFLVPLRVAGFRLPLSLLLAVVGNILFMYMAKWATGRRFLALVPGLLWFVVTIVMSGQTTEGDTVLIGGDWMPLALLLLGAGSVAVGAFLTVAPHRR
ncbi:MAG: hypothetical protein WCA46_18395 [Actinocatenispora sp.]